MYIFASDLVGKTVSVKSSVLCVTGKVVYVFPQYQIPSLDYVLKYYFDNDWKKMRESKNTKSLIRAIRFDRVVVETPTGKQYIIPYNLVHFNFEVEEDDDD